MRANPVALVPVAMAAKIVTDWLAKTEARAMMLLAEADRYLGDVVAIEAAKSLMTDRLREGHVHAIRATCAR